MMIEQVSHLEAGESSLVAREGVHGITGGGPAEVDVVAGVGVGRGGVVEGNGIQVVTHSQGKMIIAVMRMAILTWNLAHDSKYFFEVSLWMPRDIESFRKTSLPPSQRKLYVDPPLPRHLNTSFYRNKIPLSPPLDGLGWQLPL